MLDTHEDDDEGTHYIGFNEIELIPHRGGLPAGICSCLVSLARS